MKICKSCKIEKEDIEFNKKGNGLQYICKECNKIYLKEHYKNNKELYKNKADRNRNKYSLAYKKYKESLFCLDCGLSFKNKSYLCDFHHLDESTKDITIANRKFQSPLSFIKKELDKCVPLCANCHRIRHFQNNSDIV